MDLITGIYKEVERVKSIITEYETPDVMEMSKGGVKLTIALMQDNVQRALNAVESGNIVEMVNTCKELQQWQL